MHRRHIQNEPGFCLLVCSKLAVCAPEHPSIMTLSLSPPNAAMFRCTHSSAKR
eukprot:SAG31_NODE_759_length_12288_cov_5.890475_4_plen_53_part_00